MSEKILQHKDKEEIIRQLTSGVSVKKVEAWLKEKYPKDKKKHITFITLQNFRKNNLNLDKEAIDKIKESLDFSGQKMVEKKENIIAALHSSPSYQEKINEVVEAQLDAGKRIVQLEKLISSRIEYYFNATSKGMRPEDLFKADKVLVDQMKLLLQLCQDWNKYIDGINSQNNNSTVSVEAVYQQVGVIRELVRELLSELSPELALKFLEKLTFRLGQAEMKTESVGLTAKDTNALVQIEAQCLETKHEKD